MILFRAVKPARTMRSGCQHELLQQKNPRLWRMTFETKSSRNRRTWALTSPCINSTGMEEVKITSHTIHIAKNAWVSVLTDIDAIGWTTAKYLKNIKSKRFNTHKNTDYRRIIQFILKDNSCRRTILCILCISIFLYQIHLMETVVLFSRLSHVPICIHPFNYNRVGLFDSYWRLFFLQDW